jgi:hypothetical protein
MDAIRNSEDRYRTLESFWKGQVRSKVWLVEHLEKMLWPPADIVIHGGWNGVLASLLFNSEIDIKRIKSVDIDPECEEIARTVNMRQHIQGKFEAVTCDSLIERYNANLVINTICEHLTQEEYERWLTLTPRGALIVLQSNDFFDCGEHVRCAKDLKEFEKQSGLKIVYSDELETQKYTRFMIIGFRDV